jgi:hypothetical protein
MMNHLHSEAHGEAPTRSAFRWHPNDLAARRLYESLGYRNAGVERGELVMVVDLEHLAPEAQPVERSGLQR